MADNCPGGVCSTNPFAGAVAGSPTTSSGPGNVGLFTPIDTSGTYPSDSCYAGQWTIGDQYKLNRTKCEQMRQAFLAYDSLLNQFQGPESTWIRWLIQRGKGKIIGDMLGTGGWGKGMPKGWLDRYISGDMGLHTGRDGEFFRNYRGEIPALPDWMREYITPVTTEEEIGEGRRARTKTSTTYTLRPLGAQAELDADQQAMLAGWLAWSNAGFPSTYSPQALAAMSDIERYWSPYTAESQAMFPKTPTKPKWATATQAR